MDTREPKNEIYLFLFPAMKMRTPTWSSNALPACFIFSEASRLDTSPGTIDE